MATPADAPVGDASMGDPEPTLNEEQQHAVRVMQENADLRVKLERLQDLFALPKTAETVVSLDIGDPTYTPLQAADFTVGNFITTDNRGTQKAQLLYRGQHFQFKLPMLVSPFFASVRSEGGDADRFGMRPFRDGDPMATLNFDVPKGISALEPLFQLNAILNALQLQIANANANGRQPMMWPLIRDRAPSTRHPAGCGNLKCTFDKFTSTLDQNNNRANQSVVLVRNCRCVMRVKISVVKNRMLLCFKAHMHAMKVHPPEPPAGL